MEQREIVKILNEGFKQFEPRFSLVVSRNRILIAIAEKNIKPTLPEDKWKIFLETIEVEYLLCVVRFLVDKENSKLTIVELVDKLQILFRKWEGLLEFMLDHYDEMPDYLKSKASKEKLIETTGQVYGKKDILPQLLNLVGEKKFVRDMVNPLTHTNLLIRMFVVGRDSCGEFINESNRAFAFVRTLPKCREFL